MKAKSEKPIRCAIYTRVSTDQGLEQDFNSLDAQYDASQAYIRSQAHARWTLLRGKYDDGGFSGGNTDRPALQRLLADVTAGKIDVIVVYKVDRLTRSLADFAKLVELFDTHTIPGIVGSFAPLGCNPFKAASYGAHFGTFRREARMNLYRSVGLRQHPRLKQALNP